MKCSRSVAQCFGASQGAIDRYAMPLRISPVQAAWKLCDPVSTIGVRRPPNWTPTESAQEHGAPSDSLALDLRKLTKRKGKLGRRMCLSGEYWGVVCRNLDRAR